MEHLYNLDNNNLVGMWMMLGFMCALIMTADNSTKARKPIQFFYDYPYSVGIYLILGPLMMIFNIKQIIEVAKA